MKILFLGTSEFGIPTLEALAATSRYRVRVITKPDAPAGRGRRVTPPPVKRKALSLGLELFQPASVASSEGMEVARSFSPDVILVVSYARKIPEEFLDLAPHRGINIHPSLLPRHRGASPIPYAILAGDEVTGVTIIRVAPIMDSGDIVGRVEVPVEPRDTAGTLGERLSRAAPPLTMEVLEGLAAGTLIPLPQDESLVTMAPRLRKGDGLVDWSRSAEEIDRHIRAMTPRPGAFTFLQRGRKRFRLSLLEARPVPPGEGIGLAQPEPGTLLDYRERFFVSCGSGLLEILRVMREGRRSIKGDEFLRGFRLYEGPKPFLTSGRKP